MSKDSDAVSDRELVDRIRGGDDAAFNFLVDRYLTTISLLAYQKTKDRGEAEDIAQETFVRAYRSLNTLKNPDKFGSWLYNIAFRLCIDWHRRRSSRRMAVSFEELIERGADPYNEDNAADQRALEERKDELNKALEGLSDHYRLVITLRYMKHMSYREIADHLQEPEGTIANRLHRATRLLRERMTRGARSTQ